MLGYDGLADFYVRDVKDFENAFKDREYIETILPEEQKFIDPDSLNLTVGFDYVIVDAQKPVEGHAVKF